MSVLQYESLAVIIGVVARAKNDEDAAEKGTS